MSKYFSKRFYGGTRRRGYVSRGDARRTKEDIRRNSEVKYYVESNRSDTYVRNPYINNEYVGTSTSNTTIYRFVTNNSGIRGTFNNGGVLGTNIHLKRLTVNFFASLHILDRNIFPFAPRKPVAVDATYTDPLNQEGLINLDCIVRVALLQPKVTQPPSTTIVETQTFDEYFKLCETGLVPPDGVPYYTHDDIHDLLPWDPSKVKCLSEHFIPMQPSNHPACRTIPISIKMTHVLDRPMKLKQDDVITNILRNEEAHNDFYMYVSVTPIVASQDRPVLELSHFTIFKLSYYDI